MMLKKYITEYRMKFPKVFSEEGQKSLGKLSASIKFNGYKVDWYTNINENTLVINYVEYADGLIGLFNIYFNILIALFLKLFSITKDVGDEILKDLTTIHKKYITTASCYSKIIYNYQENGIRFHLENEIRRTIKEEYLKRIKYYI